MRENARRFVGIGDGYTMAHSMSDDGTIIGGFWAGTIDHASTVWVSDMMYRYVLHSGDLGFLREGAFDFMKGAMNVYRAMMSETDGGRLGFPIGPSPEWGGSIPEKCIGRNPSFQLAAAHRAARNLIDAAKRLGLAADPMWLDVERRLPQYSEGDGGIVLWEGQPLTQSHRHHSHLAGLYPFDTIDISTPAGFALAGRSFWTLVHKGYGEWSGWSMPWASALFTHIGAAEVAVDRLLDWERYFCNPGHGSRHDRYRPGFSIMNRGRDAMSMIRLGDEQGMEIMQMDGQCASAAAVLELMAHEVNGKTMFFRGCPAEWKEVAFENVSLSDGRRADGRRIGGNPEVTFR